MDKITRIALSYQGTWWIEGQTVTDSQVEEFAQGLDNELGEAKTQLAALKGLVREMGERLQEYIIPDDEITQAILTRPEVQKILREKP